MRNGFKSGADDWVVKGAPLCLAAISARSQEVVTLPGRRFCPAQDHGRARRRAPWRDAFGLRARRDGADASHRKDAVCFAVHSLWPGTVCM